MIGNHANADLAEAMGLTAFSLIIIPERENGFYEGRNIKFDLANKILWKDQETGSSLAVSNLNYVDEYTKNVTQPQETQIVPQQQTQKEERRRKTKMCRHWQKGHCQRGNACNFAHGPEDLKSYYIVTPNKQEQPKPWQQPKPWLQNHWESQLSSAAARDHNSADFPQLAKPTKLAKPKPRSALRVTPPNPGAVYTTPEQSKALAVMALTERMDRRESKMKATSADFKPKASAAAANPGNPSYLDKLVKPKAKEKGKSKSKLSAASAGFKPRG